MTFPRTESQVVIVKVYPDDDGYLVVAREPMENRAYHPYIAVTRHLLTRLNESVYPLARDITPDQIALADTLGSNDPRMYWGESLYIPVTISEVIGRDDLPKFYESALLGDEFPPTSKRLHSLRAFGGLTAAAAHIGMSEVGISHDELSKADVFFGRMKGGRIGNKHDEFVNPRALFRAARHIFDISILQHRDINAKRKDRITKQENNAVMGIAAVTASMIRARLERDDNIGSVIVTDTPAATAEIVSQHDYFSYIHWASIARINFELRKRASNPYPDLIDFVEMLGEGYDAERMHQFVVAGFTDPAIVKSMITSGVDLDLARQLSQS